MQVGDAFSFAETITEASIDAFASLSGDVSPIHMDPGFSQKKGFKGRVVHGVFLLGFLSKIVGVHFPGKHSLIQSINAKFKAPAYVGDTIECTVEVDQISTGANTIVLKAIIRNKCSSKILVKSEIQVGFTN